VGVGARKFDIVALSIKRQGGSFTSGPARRQRLGNKTL